MRSRTRDRRWRLERRGYALVTGASSGIGREIARLLADEGYDLVLLARRDERLAELRDQIIEACGNDRIVHGLAVDLRSGSAANDVSARLAHLGVSVDILVNNAGIGAFGPFVNGDPSMYREMIAVNIDALTSLLRMILPGMIERGHGRVLNVASVASFQPGPLMAVYYATKAYVLSLSEALSEELVGSGVSVTAVCPGPTRSEFHERAGIHDTGAAGSRRMPTSERVARVAVRAMMRGRRVVVHGLQFRILLFLVRFLPRRTVAAAVHRMQRARL